MDGSARHDGAPTSMPSVSIRRGPSSGTEDGVPVCTAAPGRADGRGGSFSAKVGTSSSHGAGLARRKHYDIYAQRLG